jgi:glycosyltransferase involved in cell wall biosynthesis
VDGFCFALKRKTIDRIGYFHENDVTDYSQENDYCLRAKEAGFSLAIASHSYVHHTKPRSYSVKEDLLNPALEQLKKRIDHFLTTFSFPNSSSQSLLSVLFLLPVPAGGGGTHSVMQEVAQLRQLGIEVKVAISSEHQNSYVTHYAQSFPLDEIGLFYEKESVLYQYAGNFKIVIATYFTSVKLLENIIKLHPHIVPSYYAQDYEPLFFKANTRSWHEARLSYTRVPSTVIFAKTHWIRRQIEEHHGVPVHKVKPSLDRQIFNTHNRKDHSDQIRIVAMVRIRTSWRRPQETVRVLQALKNRYGEALSIRIFGTDAQELELVGICPDGWGVNLGILNRSQVADLFRDSDLFIDLSEYQAFGRTGLEAMACGAAVVLPEKGGIREYARHQQNAILVNTDDEQICLEAIVKLIEDPDTLFKLKREGLSTSLNYSIERAAYSELILFLSAWLSKKTSLSLTKGFERPRLKYEMTQNRIMTDRDPALPFLENKWIFYRRCDFFAVPHIPVIAKAETIEGSIPIIRQLIASKRSFVMKTSHGCGDTLIITADNHGWKVRNILMPEQSIAKPEVLFQLILDHAVKQLHRSHSYQEWAVVTSWPRVLIFEEFVLGAFQADFKVCVAYGKAVFCLCCTDRYGDNGLIGGVFRRNDWNLEGCLLKTLKRFHGDRQAAEIAVKEAFSPIASDAELWTMAEKLVPPHIELQRVDFYQTANGQFLAGEYTSYSNAGLPSYEEKVEAQLASIIRSVPRVTRPFPTAFVRTESSQIPLKTLFYALDRGIPYIVIADNDEEARQAVTEGSDNVIWTALLAQKL